MPGVPRAVALGGPLGGVVATVCAVVASDLAGRGPADGLLSELGATASPGHLWYRAGQAAGAAGAVCVAAVLGRGAAARLLALAGGLIGVATAVPCTTGCPLPLVDGVPPAQDLVHLLAAGLAFACWPAATWACASRGPLRRWSRAATVGLLASLGAIGPVTVVDRDSPVVALGQRTLVLVAMLWLAGVGLWMASADDASPAAQDPRSAHRG